MIRHHPDISWLTDYAAGALPEALALPVHSHLHFCASCRRQLRRLEWLGSVLLETTARDDDSDALLAQTLARLDTPLPADAASAPAAEAPAANWPFPLPAALRKLLPASPEALHWRSLGRSLRVSRLTAGAQAHEVALHHIKAGGKVAAHGHGGQELTVVLQGSFSDDLGLYEAGDFILRDRSNRHAPQAAQNEDCLCLTVVDAPVQFTHPLLRLFNPLLRIHPA